jgi:hypothetical protein
MELVNSCSIATRLVAATALAIAPCAGADPGRVDGADWWQWAAPIHVDIHPVLDETGADCAVGQQGKDWFLAGTVGGTAERTCVVPAGRWLFFPIINQIWIDTPGQCGQVGDTSEADMRAAIAPLIDGAVNLSATLDGRSVADIRRLKSEVFPLVLPPGNLFYEACTFSGDLLAGSYPRNVDDGYYAYLHPLGVGTHVLHFHAENPSFGFAVDVTYHLVVVPPRGSR